MLRWCSIVSEPSGRCPLAGRRRLSTVDTATGEQRPAMNIYVREDGGIWDVEDRVGGADGACRHYEHRNKDAAMERFRVLMAAGDGWREMNDVNREWRVAEPYP